MPSIPLAENANLEHLKKQAKFLRDLVRSGDDGAMDMVGEFHPRLASDPLEEQKKLKLSDAQLMVARLYGFTSWNKLREHVGKRRGSSRSPDLVEANPDSASDELLRLGCVRYGADPAEALTEAQRLLTETPALGRESIFTMALVGDHSGLEELLSKNGTTATEMVNQEGGPLEWPSLLYLTYSRIAAIESGSHVKAAQVLLRFGADPNAGFLWHGLVPPFTALTGAFGYGESDQPPHPSAMELARVLLEAGADPNDGQALYNNGPGGTARDATDHLELLLEFGLGTAQSGPWYERFGGKLEEPEELLYSEMETAATRNLPKRMALMLAQGLDPNRGATRSKTAPYHLAAVRGHTEICTLLADGGATVLELSPAETFVAAVRSGDVKEVSNTPAAVREQAGNDEPALVQQAAVRGRVEVIRLLLDLGFDINGQGGEGTALHCAAGSGNLEMAQVLIELGADPNVKDSSFGAKPLHWARHMHRSALEEFLLPLTTD